MRQRKIVRPRKVTITESFIGHLEPRDGWVADARCKGLFLRTRASGAITWVVRLKHKDTGVRYWHRLGEASQLKPEAARDAATVAVGEALIPNKDPGDVRRDQKRALRVAKVRAITLRSFVTDSYAPWVRQNRKTGDETVTTLENRCTAFLDTPLCELTSFAVERWRSAYLKRGRKPATVNRVLVALKACLSKAVEWKILDRHPLAGLKLAKVDTVGRVRYLTPDEETRLLAALVARDEDRRTARASANAWRRQRRYEVWPDYGTYTDVLTPMVITLLHTGLRFGEACSLTWADVDLVSALVTVRSETAKSNRARYVPLNKTALEALKAWKPAKVDVTAYVFPGKDAARLTDIKTSWKQLLTSVVGTPIAGFRVHDLRHTFASKLVQAGVDLNTVRELLGHADIKMALRYSHLAPQHRAAAVAKLVAAN